MSVAVPQNRLVKDKSIWELSQKVMGSEAIDPDMEEASPLLLTAQSRIKEKC